jgi:transcriptional regulator with XRE-family HTH domain
MTHKTLKNKALKKSSVRKEYKRLEPEFTLLREMLRARNKAGLSQAQIAEKMGTKSPSITRLESSLSSGKHSPSLATIKKYLEVLNYRLEIKVVHNQQKAV